MNYLSSSVFARFLLFSILIIGPWCFVFLVRFFGPITYPQVSIELVLFLVLCIAVKYFAFCFGFFMLSTLNKSAPQVSHLPDRSLDDMGSIFYSVRLMVLCLTVMYVVVAISDFFVVKGATLSMIVEQREAEHLSGPRNSLIGALGALLSGGPPMLLAIMIFSKFKSFYLNLAVYVVTALGFASMFLSGGRNSFFISATFVFFCYLLFSPYSTRIRIKLSVTSFLSLVFFIYCIYFSMRMFLDRFEAQGFEVGFMLEYLELEYGVKIFRFDYDGALFMAVYSVFVYLSFYIAHAFTYLNDYFVAAYSPYMGGGYNFPQIARLIDVSFGSSFFEGGRERMLLVGVYLTLPGSLYLDFGVVGSLVVSSLIGLWSGYLARNMVRLALYQKLWLAYIAVALVFSPIYSVFGMANGFSLIFILMLVVLFSMKLRHV
ncbi:MAG: O-antigen polymerase [Pseudomonadales bacterium]